MLVVADLPTPHVPLHGARQSCIIEEDEEEEKEGEDRMNTAFLH